MTIVDVSLPAARSESGQWPDLASPVRRAELTPAAIAAVVRLADAWGLTVRQIGDLLGGVSPSTWHTWKTTPPAELGMDQLTRISLLLGIFTALHTLHNEPLADEWVTRPNIHPIFSGRTPLDVMIDAGIPVMMQVRALLDGRRSGL